MKAQNLSLSTVVIGVILLLVLAVIAFIFFRGTNNFDDGVNVCDACVVSAAECGTGIYANNPIPVPSTCSTDFDQGNEQSGRYCCRSTGG